ncbi:ABC transporter permease subunit [Clostridium estertheticum]|uniref:ABC transporter permease n=1 Tax=Clostridium estertheticum TaxID=238834 RepID=UPI0013EEAE92|nr:ABC transporter permease subunit [Clostridium estertheticum]MBZ9606828.1 ABC transporter permease subunit [Clostridium estertheticum]
MKHTVSFIKRKFGLFDIIIFASIIALLYILVSPSINHTSTGQSVVISTSLSKLPIYALKSVGRMTAAYILSLIFTFIYGYMAAHNEKAEKILVPILDILQSIPVLSFLPAVVLGLVAVFPNNNIGIEIASIILIFTGQAWNMTFSFYHSIKNIPRDLKEATEVFQLSKWQQFKTMELPFSAIGLVWNSMMSWAGGWFFLMACEMFTIKDRNFRLEGLGSYLQTAANEGDEKALLWGIITLVLVIVLLNELVWKPVIVWADKFKVELTGNDEKSHSFILTMIRRSVIIEFLSEKVFSKIKFFANNIIDNLIGRFSSSKYSRVSILGKFISIIVRIIIIILLCYSLFNALKLVSTVSLNELSKFIPAVGASLVRVLAAQAIALLWTVPVGVAIGMNKKLANIFQPIIQVIASVPATALFPVVLGLFMSAVGGLSIASVFLMLMGTQWYILFNVIAGAMAIPEDLVAASKTFGLKGFKKWKILILPAIFPYLITGMITATGGCWNATIVSEYVNFGKETFSTIGIGALISDASNSGDFPMLILSTIVMCIVVVTFNKLIWKPLYNLAEVKYKIEL